MSPRIETVDDDDLTGRVQRLLKINRSDEDVEQERDLDDSFQDVAIKVQRLSSMKPESWTHAMMRALIASVRRAMQQASERAAQIDPNNQYAFNQMIENVKTQLRSLLEHLEPPPEIEESPEFMEILRLLHPVASVQHKSHFEQGSGMHEHVKSEVKLHQVVKALEAAQKLVSKKGSESSNPHLHSFSQLDFERMARYLKRKIKKRNKQIEADGVEVDGLDEEEMQLKEEVELFVSRASEIMRTLREEIAPSWRPEQQPWLVQQADRQVYDILLATIPKELFEETAAYQEYQDLRQGHATFQYRSADRLTDAAKRSDS